MGWGYNATVASPGDTTGETALGDFMTSGSGERWLGLLSAGTELAIPRIQVIGLSPTSYVNAGINDDVDGVSSALYAPFGIGGGINFNYLAGGSSLYADQIGMWDASAGGTLMAVSHRMAPVRPDSGTVLTPRHVYITTVDSGVTVRIEAVNSFIAGPPGGVGVPSFDVYNPSVANTGAAGAVQFIIDNWGTVYATVGEVTTTDLPTSGGWATRELDPGTRTAVTFTEIAWPPGGTTYIADDIVSVWATDAFTLTPGSSPGTDQFFLPIVVCPSSWVGNPYTDYMWAWTIPAMTPGENFIDKPFSGGFHGGPHAEATRLNRQARDFLAVGSSYGGAITAFPMRSSRWAVGRVGWAFHR